MDRTRLYRIGELAELASVSPRTIDYYTHVGLLQACRRSGGNYRLYDAGALDRLKAIRGYREQGLHLSAIQARLGGLQECDGEMLLREHLEEIRELLDRMMQECTEISKLRSAMRVAAARDHRMRRALSQAAGDVLHGAITLSSLVVSAVGEGGIPLV